MIGRIKSHQRVLQKGVLPSAEGKQLFGETFTPVALINEMLDALPKSLFKDPSLRWLDPCAGVGNFASVLIDRLMRGLEEEIPNERRRLKHIFKNMIFMAEIQPNSAAMIRQIFGSDVNLFEGDFLSDNFDEKYSGRFDVVLGNPPYERIVAGRRSAKNDNLWSKFITKAMEVMTEGGHLLYVTPPSWMSPTNRQLKNIFLRYQIVFLNIQECSRHFKVGSKFSFYVVRKKPRTSNTRTRVRVKFEESKSVRQTSFSGVLTIPESATFIPQLLVPEALSILEKTCFSRVVPKLSVQYDSDLHRYTKSHLLSESRDRRFCFKVAHTPRQTLWSSRPHKNHGQIKVFIPLTTYFESTFRETCGNTQGLGYILCDNELEARKVEQVLRSATYRFIANITRWSNFNVPEVMKSLPRLPMEALDLEEITDEWIESVLAFTPVERAYLRSMVKPCPTKAYAFEIEEPFYLCDAA